ncbi:MAG: hypothetical protein ACJ746_17905 [Bryobacteraceae bacterium]
MLAGGLLFLTISSASANPGGSFTIQGVEPTPWRKIFGAVGIAEGTEKGAGILVIRADSPLDLASIAQQRIVFVTGTGPAAEAIGIRAKPEAVAVRQIVDARAPKMQIIWAQPVSVPLFEVPADFTVFAKEKWKGAPVLAGKRMGAGALVWLATDPGPSGIERYPYLLHAAVDLGLALPAQTTSLWAFFDSAYRIRAEVDYLASRWRASGIAALHVAAWHNMEPDAIQDEYLKRLIEACHRNAILVYAWVELPHVSEKFWANHPAWREQTALGQDAQLDWRKLMNLENRECRQAVEKELTALIDRFDWDGVNMAELYFESLEGASNPARFTPMNDDVRTDFKRVAGFDPKLLFDANSPYAAKTNADGLRRFLDYRADLASRMQTDWLGVVERLKVRKPYLDVALTHIDDRFEPGIRDALGADVARSLPVVKASRSTLLVEDPATLWALGPERYRKLAEKYAELTPDRDHIAVDINVVERYQDVYPTKKQTGLELAELVHEAASSFSRVALYFESSLENVDLSLLPAAATNASVKQTSADEIELNAKSATRIPWRGAVDVDGRLWPIQDATMVMVPAGRHTLSPGIERSPVTLLDFNADVQSASIGKDRVELSYASASRAIAVLGTAISSVEIDGVPLATSGPLSVKCSVVLPAGQHLVSFIKR